MFRKVQLQACVRRCRILFSGVRRLVNTRSTVAACCTLSGLSLVYVMFAYDVYLSDGGDGFSPVSYKNRLKSADARTSRLKPRGAFFCSQSLAGALFLTATSNWSAPEDVSHDVAWSVIASFSPRVEDHVKQMFQDKFGECTFNAMGPAIAKWNGSLMACIRVFLPQYLLGRDGKRKAPIDTWQENYIYTIRLNDDYVPLGYGRLLGLPASTNAGFNYRKDGPMDPRAFVYKDQLFLIYYSYGAPATDSSAKCRMYFWDFAKSVKRLITVSGLSLQQADINWSPLVVGGDRLYLVYSLDPLRVLHCQPETGACVLHYPQPAANSVQFSWSRDHLRGGTPFVEYSYPYYVSAAHSTIQHPGVKKALYHVHLVTIRIDVWRLVYVSDGVLGSASWLNSTPLVLSDYVASAFWYPTTLLVRDKDTFDVGCHLNDRSSHVIRLEGMDRLMNDVITKDSSGDASNLKYAPPARAAQTYVYSTLQRRLL